MTVSHRSDRVDVGHVGVRVTECLGIDCLRVRLNSGFQRSQVVDIDDRIGHALGSQRMGDQVERATVKVISGYDMIAYTQDVLQGIGSCSGT